MRGLSPASRHDRRDAYVLLTGKCCRIFCGAPPDPFRDAIFPGTALGEMLPIFLRRS